MKMPPSVNYHVTRRCTMNCVYCFGCFRDVPDNEIIKDKNASVEIAKRIASKFEKVTITGGEPLLFPHVEEMLQVCKEAGATTMLVSNGSPLVDDPTRVHELAPVIDWFGISIDSAVADTNRKIGRVVRGQPIPIEAYIELATNLRKAGVRLKLNTVVSSLNVNEDMHRLVTAIQPERWKIFQVIKVVGQNDKKIDDVLISEESFQEFVHRHRDLDVDMKPEANSVMYGSYAMVDPSGRFFDNVNGSHRYSLPLLDVGIQKAFAQVFFDFKRFEQRGGRYAW
ncbi:MAG: radical SAM protein [Proteobacteria bacterium]|nr:radical SAM protein [Pseudomonadota bacterium]